MHFVSAGPTGPTRAAINHTCTGSMGQPQCCEHQTLHKWKPKLFFFWCPSKTEWPPPLGRSLGFALGLHLRMGIPRHSPSGNKPKHHSWDQQLQTPPAHAQVPPQQIISACLKVLNSISWVVFFFPCSEAFSALCSCISLSSIQLNYFPLNYSLQVLSGPVEFVYKPIIEIWDFFFQLFCPFWILQRCY